MIIYDDEYMEIAEFIRAMMNVHPKVEKAKVEQQNNGFYKKIE